MYLREKFSLRSFADKYQELAIEVEGNANHTNQFLTALIDNQTPVVFLVPPRLMSHEKAGVTKEEFEFLISNTSRLKNIYFIFGSYYFDGDWIDRIYDVHSSSSFHDINNLYDRLMKGDEK